MIMNKIMYDSMKEGTKNYLALNGAPSEWQLNIVARPLSIDEVVDAYDKGNLLGVFGTGTAAIISSVGWLTYKDKQMNFNNGKPGELDLKLFDELTSIHYGLKEDTHNWLTNVTQKEVATT